MRLPIICCAYVFVRRYSRWINWPSIFILFYEKLRHARKQFLYTHHGWSPCQIIILISGNVRSPRVVLNFSIPPGMPHSNKFVICQIKSERSKYPYPPAHQLHRFNRIVASQIPEKCFFFLAMLPRPDIYYFCSELYNVHMYIVNVRDADD